MTESTKAKVSRPVSRTGNRDVRMGENRSRDAASRGKKMMEAWGKWMSEHADMIISTEAGGKTKRVTASGVSDTKNDIILCSFAEAESHEAAAKAFEDHPHLQIPRSSIEVMYVSRVIG